MPLTQGEIEKMQSAHVEFQSQLQKINKEWADRIALLESGFNKEREEFELVNALKATLEKECEDMKAQIAEFEQTLHDFKTHTKEMSEKQSSDHQARLVEMKTNEDIEKQKIKDEHTTQIVEMRILEDAEIARLKAEFEAMFDEMRKHSTFELEQQKEVFDQRRRDTKEEGESRLSEKHTYFEKKLEEMELQMSSSHAKHKVVYYHIWTPGV